MVLNQFAPWTLLWILKGLFGGSTIPCNKTASYYETRRTKRQARRENSQTDIIIGRQPDYTWFIFWMESRMAALCARSRSLAMRWICFLFMTSPSSSHVLTFPCSSNTFTTVWG